MRVVYQDDNEELTDVPADGKTVGEVITRGNIVMKEVSESRIHMITKDNAGHLLALDSTSKTQKQRRKLSAVDISEPEISRSCTGMEASRSEIGARTSLSQGARFVRFI